MTLTYERDRQGRITERKTVLNDQGGATFYQAYTYNERGRVKEIYASTSKPDPSTGAPDVEYDYAPHGAIDSVRYEGGAWIARDYDARDRLTQVDNTSSPEGFTGTYTYDADGTVDEAFSAFSGSSSYTYHFGYDAEDRLQSADFGGNGLSGKYDVSGISYDQNGNLKALERYGDGGSLVDDLSYTYGGSSPNRLTSLTDGAGAVHGWDAGGGSFSYTVLGQMAESPAPQGLTGAVYGAGGQLLAAERGGQTITYRYDASGQRTAKQVGTQEVRYYVRDGETLLATVEGGTVQHWNITRPGGQTVGQGVPGAATFYYVTDLLGSIRAVIDGGGGSVDAVRSYYPFGLPLEGRYEKSSTPTREDYTGHLKDDSTDLHYAGARYYSSAFGRWLRPDPVLGRSRRRDVLSGDLRLTSHAEDLIDHRLVHVQSGLPKCFDCWTNLFEIAFSFGHDENTERTEDRNVQSLPTAARRPVVHEGRPSLVLQSKRQDAAFASPEVPGGHGFSHRPGRLHKPFAFCVEPRPSGIVRRSLTDLLGHCPRDHHFLRSGKQKVEMPRLCEENDRGGVYDPVSTHCPDWGPAERRWRSREPVGPPAQARTDSPEWGLRRTETAPR